MGISLVIVLVHHPLLLVHVIVVMVSSACKFIVHIL